MSVAIANRRSRQHSRWPIRALLRILVTVTDRLDAAVDAKKFIANPGRRVQRNFATESRRAALSRLRHNSKSPCEFGGCEDFNLGEKGDFECPNYSVAAPRIFVTLNLIVVGRLRFE
jgi:hypothetical protein